MKHSLIVEYRNTRPIDLLELTTSLAAVGDQFKRFVADEGGIDAETRLFVHQIRPGSTIAELIALGKAAADFYDSASKLTGFAPMIYDLLQTVLLLPPRAKELDKPSVRNAAAIVTPIALDAGASLNMIDNRGGTIIQQYTVTPMEAATIRHNAQHLLNSQFPDEVHFSNEPLTLFQMRNAPPGKTGDWETIDAFSPRAHKLTFAGDAVKDAILHHEGNPFETVFWVNGIVKTAGGSVVGYLLTELVEATPKGA